VQPIVNLMQPNNSEAGLNISETFYSLQGEGLDIGLPYFFIRLSGCNLACSYCDTTYANSKGDHVSVNALVEAWRASGVKHCLITGGEPLLQQNTVLLIKSLLSSGASVSIETNGSLDVSDIPEAVVKILDRKTPGSSMDAHWLDENLAYLSRKDQVKFVITSREDYLFSLNEIERCNLLSRAHVIFSPAMPVMEPTVLADWILKDKLEVRFQLQLHKILWGDRPGV